jgi:protein-disulfide isomerase
MKSATVPLALLVLIALLASATAQTSKRRGVAVKPPAASPQPTPAQTAAMPSPTPAPVITPAGPIAIVVVNGQTISTADFEPEVRQEVESTEAKVAAARRDLLDVQINTLLLEVEARKRGITSHRLYELEVVKKIPAPTPAQVKKFIDDNQAQFEGVDPSVANPQVSAYLHDQFENNLSDDLVKRLRKTNPVVIVADVNNPNLSDETILATISGQPLKAAMMNERLKPVLYKIRSESYQLAKRRADQMVDDLLLLAEANRLKIGPEEIVRAEISNKVKTPTEAEVAKFYSENKARITGDLATVRNQLVAYLQNEDKQKLEKDLSTRLRKNADLRWLITEPVPPVQNISVDDDPSRGDATAPVTVVEFTDFQCPACGAMHPILDEVLKSYGNRVRFVVRDFPLTMHANARKAAEAANAANAQGKFFEYISLLFTRQKALDVPSLKKYASELGLNRARFDAALDGGVYEAEIKHDIEDGEIYGISGTPTIFINGVKLETLTAEGLREAIDRAAVAKGTPK